MENAENYVIKDPALKLCSSHNFYISCKQYCRTLNCRCIKYFISSKTFNGFEKRFRNEAKCCFGPVRTRARNLTMLIPIVLHQRRHTLVMTLRNWCSANGSECSFSKP